MGPVYDAPRFPLRSWSNVLAWTTRHSYESVVFDVPVLDDGDRPYAGTTIKLQQEETHETHYGHRKTVEG